MPLKQTAKAVYWSLIRFCRQKYPNLNVFCEILPMVTGTRTMSQTIDESFSQWSESSDRDSLQIDGQGINAMHTVESEPTRSWSIISSLKLGR